MLKKIILVAFIFIAALWAFAWPQYFVGDCMEPALKDKSYLFLNRALPYLRNYKIDDIVAFNYEGILWIARVVALAKDTIEITENKITVNGKQLEDQVKRNWANWKYGEYAIEKPYTVPQGSLYVLSDNLSAHHDDSRVFGPISKKDVVAIVW